MPGDNQPRPDDRGRFSLRALLEFATVCCLLAALAPRLGAAASGALMLLALALWMRQGECALAMLMAVSWGASAGATEASELWTQLGALTVAGGLCAWYAYRREEGDSCVTQDQT